MPPATCLVSLGRVRILDCSPALFPPAPPAGGAQVAENAGVLAALVAYLKGRKVVLPPTWLHELHEGGEVGAAPGPAMKTALSGVVYSVLPQPPPEPGCA